MAAVALHLILLVEARQIEQPNVSAAKNRREKERMAQKWRTHLGSTRRGRPTGIYGLGYRRRRPAACNPCHRRQRLGSAACGGSLVVASPASRRVS
uniref:Uncharacterized protein n=1 Tax=Arundo donax TaxID=35708 RepID=A0A0A9DVT6_ARUDO